MFELEDRAPSQDSPETVEALLALVTDSKVLPDAEASAYLERLGAAGTLPIQPADLAAAMVRDGLLTQFQAKHFLAGKSQGLVIREKYLLLDHLGTGGMGSVYLCEHKSMRRRVAIKVLPPSQAQNAEVLERFYREARAVATLDHPNIVRAHDIDHDGPLHFLVMEYVDGVNLHEIVKRRGPLDPGRACHYIRQAALGLQEAHETGLVHRDIKPGNLLIDRTGVIKILDLGLARFFHDTHDNLTSRYDEHAVLGTADYLAPEQAVSSHSVDIRADIYSLGATFYYLLTGAPPCGEGSVAQKILWHQLRPVPDVREQRPEVPAGVAAILQKMMAKDPAERQQTPGEVCDALEAFTPASVPPPSEEDLPRLDPAAKRAPSSTVRTRGAETASKRTLVQKEEKERGEQDLLSVGAAPGSGGRWVAAGAGVTALAAIVLAIAWWRSSRPEVSAPLVSEQRPESEAVAAAEPVAIVLEGDAHRIKTPFYEAVVEQEGALGSLRVDGVEVLKPRARYTRGAGVYQAKVGFLPLVVATPTQPGDGTLVASSEKAVIEYRFGPDTITCKVTNKIGAELKYWVVIDGVVTTVMNEQGESEKIPFPKQPATERLWPTTIWPIGDARLTIGGGTKIWGDWWQDKGKATVYEANLGSQESCTVVFKISKPGSETQEPARRLNGPAARPADR